MATNKIINVAVKGRAEFLNNLYKREKCKRNHIDSPTSKEQQQQQQKVRAQVNQCEQHVGTAKRVAMHGCLLYSIATSTCACTTANKTLFYGITQGNSFDY